MSVQFVSVKCPECGALLNIEEGRSQAFCSYCGTKILVHNDNEKIYRHIDEAGIKQAETDRIIRLRQMELEEKAREEEMKAKTFKFKMGLIIGAIGVLMMVVGYMLGDATGDSDSGFYMISLIGFFPLMAGGSIITSALRNKSDKKK